jgi:hypothetical protein
MFLYRANTDLDMYKSNSCILYLGYIYEIHPSLMGVRGVFPIFYMSERCSPNLLHGIGAPGPFPVFSPALTRAADSTAARPLLGMLLCTAGPSYLPYCLSSRSRSHFPFFTAARTPCKLAYPHGPAPLPHDPTAWLAIRLCRTRLPFARSRAARACSRPILRVVPPCASPVSPRATRPLLPRAPLSSARAPPLSCACIQTRPYHQRSPWARLQVMGRGLLPRARDDSKSWVAVSSAPLLPRAHDDSSRRSRSPLLRACLCPPCSLQCL